MFTEHCHDPDSDQVYTSSSYPTLSTSDLLTSGNTYPTTIALIVSDIKKLSSVAKVPQDGVVWRNLASGVRLPDQFFEPDEQVFAWGMDTAFMTTSRDETVALKCNSGEGEGEGRTVFKILLVKMSLGANIACHSFTPPTPKSLSSSPRIKIVTPKLC
jgi:hypothetical protein